jgi:NAD(P)-dependent dehydrogenase (short-subunit alcohol dehydrogenase family)
MPQTESYTAAKGGIAALTHALAVSLAGKVRVNSISPGWIDTAYTVYEGPDAIQQPVGRVGNPLDIANMVLIYVFIVTAVSIQPGEMLFTRTFPARLTASAWVSAAIPPFAAV